MWAGMPVYYQRAETNGKEQKSEINNKPANR